MLLLHLLEEPSWTEEMKPQAEVFSAYKERGLIKTLGCSCHSYGVMETAATSAWVLAYWQGLIQRGIRCDGDADEVLEAGHGERAGDLCDRTRSTGQGSWCRSRCVYEICSGMYVFDALTLGMSS